MDLIADIASMHGLALSESSGKAIQAVMETPEFRRIRDLPRRTWEDSDIIEEMIDAFTGHFKLPHGSWRLKPVQSAALNEMYLRKGLFAPIRVGGGKTLISALGAEALDAKRPLLLVPGKLVEKTRRSLLELSRHWKMRPISVVSYTSLSRDYDNKILGGLRPDLIIADEGHKLKNTKAGCTKRVAEYLRDTRKAYKAAGEEWPYGCAFVCMSGSVTTRSLREYWHLIRWALGDYSPLPADPFEMMSWASAIDAKVSQRIAPGALPRLDVNAQGKDDLERARCAYGTRLVSTPGVVSSGNDRPPYSLDLFATKLDAPAVLRDAITKMRATYETPDGHPFEMPMELWRHCRELQCGFYYVWDPRPPQAWKAARKEWGEFWKEILKHSRTYHTYGHLVQAVKAGKIDDHGLYMQWIQEDSKYKYRVHPEWVDDTTLQYAAKWLEESKGLCWVEHQEFGKKLSKMTGIPYFVQNARTEDGKLFIADHKGPAILALKSCSEGLDLQFKWHTNLYVSPPTKNDMHEQSLGRTHRDGQVQDEVTAEYLTMCLESYNGLYWAVKEGEYTERTTKAPQKLCYATRDFAGVEGLLNSSKDELWKGSLVEFDPKEKLLELGV